MPRKRTNRNTEKRKPAGSTAVSGRAANADFRRKLPSDSELLHTLLDNISDAIYFKDLKSRFIKVNRYWIKKVAVGTTGRIEGKTDFDFFTAEHARQAFNDEQKMIRTGKPIIGIEEKETWPDRPDSWVSTTKMPFRNKNGTVIGTFGLSRDITEIKKYRDALQKAKNELEERVRKRTAELSDAKEKLEQHLEQLTFLNVTAYELAHIVDAGKMFTAIGKAFLARFPFAKVVVCQKMPGGFSCVYASTGLDSPEARALSEKALVSFAKKELKEPLLVENWRSDKTLRVTWPLELAEFPCYLALPLSGDSQMLAVVQILSPLAPATAVFNREKNLLSTLAAHAAACLNNVRHHRYLEIQARIEGELEAARNIQQSFTPHGKPSIPGISLSGLYIPAHEVSGDYLDYFQCGDQSWAVFVADVCGKGMPAALLMTVLRTLARSESQTHFTAKSLLCAINESICLSISERSFISALCLVVRSDGRSMTYARAGHPRLLKMNGSRGVVETIDCKGPALGIFSTNADFASQLDEIVLPLAAGDTYLAYTDGLTETDDAQKESTYGRERLIQAMKRCGNLTPDDLLAGILADVRGFASHKAFRDDLTMFALKVA